MIVTNFWICSRSDGKPLSRANRLKFLGGFRVCIQALLILSVIGAQRALEEKKKHQKCWAQLPPKEWSIQLLVLMRAWSSQTFGFASGLMANLCQEQKGSNFLRFWSLYPSFTDLIFYWCSEGFGGKLWKEETPEVLSSAATWRVKHSAFSAHACMVITNFWICFRSAGKPLPREERLKFLGGFRVCIQALLILSVIGAQRALEEKKKHQKCWAQLPPKEWSIQLLVLMRAWSSQTFGFASGLMANLCQEQKGSNFLSFSRPYPIVADLVLHWCS